MSDPQSNSSVTSEMLARETECMVSRPRSTPTTSSTGRVMSVSTSWGAVSGKSVWTVREGYAMSGKSSSERRE